MMARSLRASSTIHTAVGRHHLSEQTAFTAQRVVQLWQQNVQRRFACRHNAWVSGHARQRKIRASFLTAATSDVSR